MQRRVNDRPRQHAERTNTIRPAAGRRRLARLARLACALALGGLATARGQPAPGAPESESRFIQQQRLADQQLEQQRQQLAPLQSMLDFQWGGWFDYYMFAFNDGVQSSRFVNRPGLTLWARASVDQGAHEMFARMKLRYTYFQPGDEIERQQDWVGPEFDQLWYQIDVGRAFRLNKPSDPVQMKVRIGRQPVLFGTGYALDLPMDAVLVDAKLWDFRVLGLIGKSIPNLPNIDRSGPVHSHSDRDFYGVQLQYEHFQNHVPFIYALWNTDQTAERHSQWSQDYRYNSAYLGAGSRGSIVHNLNYWAEGVLEWGSSTADRNFLRQDPIRAWGWDFGLEKLFDLPMRPKVSGEYMFASGDGDRRFSPTNAAGGNRGGTSDTSFVGFGFRDTGIAAAPTMSNLHVWRAGASFSPLEKLELFRDFELGTNWFLYHKNRGQAAISDPTADMFEGYVGWEMDYFINWRLASDVSWTLRWGEFFPGSAFSDQGSRAMVFTGITWSF